MPRILQYLDFFSTKPGTRLMVWAPRSAGLFAEENGVRKYIDEDLEACMVYGSNNGSDLKYNLASGVREDRYFPPAYPKIEVGFKGAGLNNPKYADYDLQNAPREASSANRFFSTGVLFPPIYAKTTVFKTPFTSNFVELPNVKRFWDVKASGFESVLYKTFAARSDEEFETAYNNMVQYAADNGLDEDTCREIEQRRSPATPAFSGLARKKNPFA